MKKIINNLEFKKYFAFKYLLILALGITFISQNTNAQLINRWEKVKIPPNFENFDQYDSYLDVYFLPQNPKYGWICGNNSKMLITTDSGNTWRGVFVSNVSHQLETVQFVNEQVGFASGPNRTPVPFGENPYPGSIFKSVDGGNSWFNITPRNTSVVFWGLQFKDENNGIALAGDCFFQYFYRTTDGGASWSVIAYNSEGGKLSDPVIIDFEGLCYAIGSGALWQSTNGGRTWSIKSFTGDKDWHEELAIKDSSMIVPVSTSCEGTYNSEGGIRFSSDLGNRWNNYTNVRGPLFGSFLIDEYKGWACGFNRGVYYTCDAGNSYTVIDCGLEGDLDDIFFINDTTGWVVGKNVYRSATAMTTSTIIVKDTAEFCDGDFVTITADSTYNKFRWINCAKSLSQDVDYTGENIAYHFNTACDTAGLVIKFPTKKNPNPDYQINLTSVNSNSLCIGDTIKLSVSEQFVSYLWSTGDTTQSIIVTESGEYSVSVINEFGCKTIKNYNVNFNPLPEPEIEVLGKDRVCIGDSILINSKNTHSKYEWYDKSTNALISNSKSTYIKKDGTYYLKVTNEFGCSNFTEDLNLSFINDSNRLEIMIDNSSNVNFGKDTLNTVYCRDFTVYNTSNSIFVLDSLYLFQKINFSYPSSQLPLLINPNDTVKINICFYSLEKGKYFDTLKIADVCNDKLVFLNAEVEGYDLSGKTRCNLEWTIEVVKIKNDYQMQISPIYPNPVSSRFRIDIEEYIPKINKIENKAEQIEYSIYNSFGIEVEKGYLVYPNNILINANGQSYKYNLEIDLQNSKFNSGLYLITFKSSNSNELKSQMFVKE